MDVLFCIMEHNKMEMIMGKYQRESWISQITNLLMQTLQHHHEILVIYDHKTWSSYLSRAVNLLK